ncbi:glycosyltransferase [Oceanicella actignis]|uniref:Glycosyl transferase family 2 n=1 Tax=Oceanicella actignis TaxID=1189325 RepID=A0A1M7T4N5_9RHOB|nr:glycosyltransferase [Oceanicella actignis]SET41785.1 Glycosyl transferase family 2 [Oceanicella actignis]SHN65657.1 Glycosyl transferase family 2 [Oceanicella actignis]
MTAGPEATLFLMAFRQEHTVAEAVAALLGQRTERPLEIILSDDASDDGTFETMRRIAQAYRGPHQVRLNRNPRNLGVTGHVDRIMELARGRLIILAAGDDISEPDRAQTLIDAWHASQGTAMLLHSSAAVVDAEGRRLGVRRPEPLLISEPTPRNIVCERLRVLGATAAWDRAIYERFGPLGPGLGVEDTILPFRAALLGRIVHVDRELVRWRAGGLSWKRGAPDPRELLYGTPLRLDRWRAQNCRHILERFADLDYPGKDEVEAACRAEILRCSLRVDLAEAGALGRAAMAPRAALTAMRLRSSRPLRDWARYAFEPAYKAYYRRRYGAPAGAESRA